MDLRVAWPFRKPWGIRRCWIVRVEAVHVPKCHPGSRTPADRWYRCTICRARVQPWIERHASEVERNKAELRAWRQRCKHGRLTCLPCVECLESNAMELTK